MRGKIHPRGLSMVEVVIYLTILAGVSLLLVDTLLVVARSYYAVKLTKNIDTATLAAMDRMTYEIRNAISVDQAGSTLGTSPGTLKLNTKDASDTATTVEFRVSGDIIQIKEGAGAYQTLLPTGVTVTNLIFRRITTGLSEAVKVEMTIQSTLRGRTKTENFYDTVVLRRSYST